MSGVRKRVLWVDDEIEFLRSHIMFLETRGYSVTPVFSGDDAITLIHRDPAGFDIVLLDEQMPGKDGLTTLEEIKDFLPDLPVVMVTKSEEEHVMDEALGKKIDGYLTKPVNPSQILLVCKRMIDSRRIMSSATSRKFIRQFSQNRVLLKAAAEASDWVRFYEAVTRWDFELEALEDEGIRQNHAGQKSDGNAEYCAFIENAYSQWVRGRQNPPVLSPDVIPHFVMPLIKSGKHICLVVLDSMRLDQYCAIEPFLRKYYDIDRRYYFSIIPTSGPFCRNALLAGKYPSEIKEAYPDLWTDGSAEADVGSAAARGGMLLTRQLQSLGFTAQKDVRYFKISESSDWREITGDFEIYRQTPLVTLDVDFGEMLIQSRRTSSLIQEIVPDEAALRSLTQSWFQFSTMYQVLKELARSQCTVIITSDHGSILSSRPAEIYGAHDFAKNARFIYGQNISCDERQAIVLSDPAVFKLPQAMPGGVMAIAKENYYFKSPDKFENYSRNYHNAFHYGGISLDEMIVPLAIMTPK